VSDLPPRIEPPPPEDDRAWGDPIGPLSLQWATPAADPPPLPDVRPSGGAPPAAPRPPESRPRRPPAHLIDAVQGPPDDRLLARHEPSRRIHYRVGAWRRTRSVVELLIIVALLAGVLAAVFGAGVAGLVALFHHVAHGGGTGG